MTDAHNPRVLTDADAAADLAGLTRPSLPERAADRISKGILTGSSFFDEALTQDELDRLSAASWIRTLVSERDALAVRVSELTDDRDCWRDQCSQRVADWAAEHERVRELEQDAARYRLLRDLDHWPAAFDSSSAPEPVRGPELDAAIDAALTQQEKTNG